MLPVAIPSINGAPPFRHYAFTYDRASGNASIYVDGILRKRTYLGSFTPRTTGDVIFGGASTNNFYDSAIDELCLYDRALSEEEMYQLVNAGAGGKMRPSDNLAPTVDPGPDKSVALTTTSITLQGVVSDDSLPTGAPVRSLWTKL